MGVKELWELRSYGVKGVKTIAFEEMCYVKWVMFNFQSTKAIGYNF